MKLNSVINVLLVFTMLSMFPTSDTPVSFSSQDVIVQSVRAASYEFPHSDQRGPEKTDRDRLGVVTNAPSVIVRDVESGVVLTGRGEDIVRPIASITKLMTALVLLDEYQWGFEDAATVLREDVREGGRWRISFGDEVMMDDLFTVMLVASGNNETLASVREVGASETEFVEKMNEKAIELGMVHTSFADPVGLSPRNVSTAQELGLLLDAALEREEIRERLVMPSVSVASGLGNEYNIDSTDKLLNSFLNQAPYTVVGGKTGSLIEAGYCLTIRIVRDGHPIDVTVLGASVPDARFSDVKALAGWVFDVFKW